MIHFSSRLNHAIRVASRAHEGQFRKGSDTPYIAHPMAVAMITQQYMEDEDKELKDYKFFCFDGVPRFLFVATGRQKGDLRFDFFDTDFGFIPVTKEHPNADVMPTKPKNFKKMLEIASLLSKGIPHVRVDLYNVNGKIYFSELTFYSGSGFTPFNPSEWDRKFGSYLILPNKKK